MYGIEVGQEYIPADGSKNTLTVLDIETYAYCDDVVVFDHDQNKERRIDAVKLAMVRYRLVVVEEISEEVRAHNARTEYEAAMWMLERIQPNEEHGGAEYNADEIALLRKQLKAGNEAALKEIERRGGVKLHPRIAEARKKGTNI